MAESETNPWLEFVDAPWLGIGVGMVIGSFGSLFSVKWLIFVGWFIICLELSRHDFFKKGKIVRGLVTLGTSCVIGFTFYVIWHVVPKPLEPLTKKDVQEVVQQALESTPRSATTTAPQPDSEDSHVNTKAELADAVRKAIAEYKPSVAEGIANLTNEQLSDEAASTVTEAWYWYSGWDGTIRAIDRGTLDGIQFAHPPMDEKAIAAWKKPREQRKKEYTIAERKKTRNTMKRLCRLRNEIMTTRLEQVPPPLQDDKTINNLCARIATVDYGPDDMRLAANNLSQLQKSLASTIKH